MRLRALWVALAVIVVACLPLAGNLFDATLTSPDGSYDLPVTLGDQTGLVVAIEPAAFDSSVVLDSAVVLEVDPDDPSSIIVRWIGGACDNKAEIALASTGARFRMRVKTHVSFGACMGLGIHRAVRITTSRPISIGDIDANSER